jgi:hypothetical protein
MKKNFLLSVCVAIVTLPVFGQANTSLSNLTGPTAVNVPLLPKGDNTKNLGSAGKSWKDLYLDGKSYLGTAYSYFDNGTNQFRINNGADRLVIGNTGNIGIGTLTPARTLDVQTTTLTPVMQVTKPWTGSGTTNFNLVEINNAYNFGYGTGLFSSGGQMGIKGYAPNGGVTGYGVYGEAFGAAGSSYGVYGKATTDGVAVGLYGYASSSGSTAYGVYGYGSGTTSWAGYFAGRGYFTGNVGIGTTVPDVKLHVVGGADISLTSGGYIVAGSITAENIGIDNNEIMARNNGATSTLYLNHSGGNVVMCTSSGSVSIGTTTPASGYILSVDGKIMAEEMRVQLSGNWPDYVFNEAYKLPSLYNLEASVKENKHLPGIPSADEVKKDGISVGQMQTKMMEKIEELTLYVISLQKQIDEFKKAQK